MINNFLRIAIDHISNDLDKHGNAVLSVKDLQNMFSIIKTEHGFPDSVTFNKLLKLLLENTKLIKHTFTFPERKYIKYTWISASAYLISLSFRPKSYFTHRTAMFLNGLAEKEPTTIYVNYEQKPNKYKDRELIQSNIDLAFSRNARISNNVATFDNKKIYLLNGMYTNGYGVASQLRYGEELLYTDIERTLIDITVRPNYSGGVKEVLKAYRNAKNKVSISKLADTLKQLDYIYPYHQAIGFYLDKSGVYSENDIDAFKRISTRYDFYLSHNITNKNYSKEWRLYYPDGL